MIDFNRWSHDLFGEACRYKVFLVLVSFQNNITIDKVNIHNNYIKPVFESGSGELYIKNEIILSNGGLIKYHENEVEGKTTMRYKNFMAYYVTIEFAK